MNRSGIIYPDPNDTFTQTGYSMAGNQAGGLPDNANNPKISKNSFSETQTLGKKLDFESKDETEEVSSESELFNGSYWDKNSLDEVVSLMQKGSNVPDFSSRKSTSIDDTESEYKIDPDKRQYDDVLVGKSINSGDKNSWSSVEERRKNNLRNFSNSITRSHTDINNQTENTGYDKSTDKTEIDRGSAYGKDSTFKSNEADTKDDSEKALRTDKTANSSSTFQVDNSKVEKKSKNKKSERPEKSDGMLLSFMFIFEIFRWLMGTDVIVRFILGAIAGVVGFGLIFSRLGALGYF